MYKVQALGILASYSARRCLSRPLKLMRKLSFPPQGLPMLVWEAASTCFLLCQTGLDTIFHTWINRTASRIRAQRKKHERGACEKEKAKTQGDHTGEVICKLHWFCLYSFKSLNIQCSLNSTLGKPTHFKILYEVTLNSCILSKFWCTKIIRSFSMLSFFKDTLCYCNILLLAKHLENCLVFYLFNVKHTPKSLANRRGSIKISSSILSTSFIVCFLSTFLWFVHFSLVLFFKNLLTW
jgi:hypothetical protein